MFTIFSSENRKLIDAASKGDTREMARLLSRSDVDKNFQDKDGHTALLDAARNGHLQAVKVLLQANADANLQDKDGDTALISSAFNGHLSVVKVLVEAHSDANLQNNDGYTALIFAAMEGHLHVVKVLLQAGAAVNLQNTRGGTALMAAAWSGHLQVVKVLLQAGADVNLRNKGGESAWDEASTEEIKKCLAQHKGGGGAPSTIQGEPSLQSKPVSTFPVSASAVSPGAAAVSSPSPLPVKGSPPSAPAPATPSIRGNQELIYAAGKCDQGTAARLLAMPEVDKNFQDKDGHTALMIAAEKGNLEVVKVLLQANADVNLQDKDGDTAIISAAFNGHLEVVNALMQAKADVNLRNKDGYTALIFAAMEGHLHVVKVLLQAGAAVNLQNTSGGTALMAAAWNSQLQVVKVLLQAGADVNLLNKTGKTAWDLASTEGVKMCLAQHKGDAPATLMAPASPQRNPVSIRLPSEKYPTGPRVAVESNLSPLPIPAGKISPPHITPRAAAVPSHSPCTVPTSAGTANPPPPVPAVAIALVPTNPSVAPAPCATTAPLALPSTAITTAALSLEDQTRVLLAQAAKVQWMRRRDALQGRCDAAKKAKKYSELAQLGKALAAVLAEPEASAALSDEDYRTLVDRHTKLINTVDAECLLKAEAEDFVGLELLSQLLESLQAINSSELRSCTTDTRSSEPAAELALSESAALQYLCGSIPIVVSQPLKTATARVLLRGKFSASVVNMAFNTTTVTEVQCVIKCAVRVAEGEHVLDSVSALRSEHGIYKLLQSGAGATGCVQCYSAHPLYHYLVLEDHGQDLTQLLTHKLQNGHQVVYAIVESVQALHSLGVVHGDIKPLNILFHYTSLGQCEVKLCDLDCARKVGEECPAATLGTDFFHAPEVYHAARRNATVRAALEIDLFPLGLVLWQVLQRSSTPALSHTTESQLQECYADQAKLWEHLPVPARGQWSYQYLQSLTSLEPHKRTSASALLQKIQVLNASNAQHGWLEEQHRNDFIQKNVSELSDKLDQTKTELSAKLDENHAGLSDKLDQANAKLDKVLEVLQTKFDSLGQEVVGVAATLRKEMLLGREHGQVLEGMLSTTQEALDQLSRSIGGREAGSDQITSVLGSLQARIEHGVAAALAKQYSNRTAGPDPSAAALSELSSQFQSRFTALSTDVKQLMEDQRRAQAASASSEQEQQRQAQQMHQRLSSTLQEVLNGVSAVKLEVQQLRQDQEALGRQVAVVLSSNAELAAMVNTLISGTHTIPTLAIILPVVSTSWRSVLSPMRLVRNQFRLFFLCSHTNRIAPGGPKGKGYKINVTKQWVQDAAPVLRVGLVLVKLALLSAGLPLPVPDLPALLGASGLHAKYLDAALHLVQNPADDSGGSEFDMDKVIDKLASLGNQHLLQEQGLSKDKGGMTLQEASRKAYETIQEVLTKDGVNIALTSGLRQVTHKGKTAWVMDNDAVEVQFKASL